ncbi:MAG: hypothetical protein LBI85_00715 [Spirochaetaceae bacterium]|jgi:hypothetical protein|nr:hypothetical protein [Spirochaetaceae bacterium]
MKYTSLIMFLALFSCSGPLMPRSHTLKAPPLPETWAFLGPPSWHIEWIDNSGIWRRAEAEARNGIILAVIESGETWTGAVLAWPFWPDTDCEKGVFRPAGAIVPFDISGGRVVLSWQGGVDAFFYRELARFGWGSTRSPDRFDWPRFRELFSGAPSPLLPEIRENPWLVDWTGVAVKTIASGFDRRRLVSAYTGSVSVPAPAAGPWAASNPFVLPPGSNPWELGAAPWVDTFVSPQGTAKVSQAGFIWRP